MFYWIFLYTNIALICGLNLAFNLSFTTFLYLLLSFAIVLIPSLFVDIIIRLLPRKWFDYHKKIYYVSERESKFYKDIGIRDWKDKIPELGKTVNFSKAKLCDPNNPEYIERFILETCLGSMTHVFCMVSALGFSVFGLLWHGFLTMTLPVAVVYGVMNIPSILIQRYNRPRLIKKLERMTRVQIGTQNMANSLEKVENYISEAYSQDDSAEDELINKERT